MGNICHSKNNKRKSPIKPTTLPENDNDTRINKYKIKNTNLRDSQTEKQIYTSSPSSNEVNKNIPFKFQPIPFEHKRDDNLELTNYFQNINLEEQLERSKYLENSTNIIYRMLDNKNDNNIEDNELNIISQTIENNFGFFKEIEEDFEITKVVVSSCSDVDLKNKEVINTVPFSEFFKNEENFKFIIKDFIKENQEEIINIIDNKK